MTSPTLGRHVLAAVLAASGSGALSAAPYARDVDAEKAAERTQQAQKPAAPAAAAVPVRYPLTTRVAPEGRATATGVPKLQAMLKLFNEGRTADARAAADAVLAGDAFNPYEKGFAAKLATQIALDGKNYSEALGYASKAVALDSLDNDSHFDLMLLAAQLQLQAKDYSTALATLDSFLAGSGSTKPEHLVAKGNALYRLGKYADAAVILKRAVAAAPGHVDWTQMLADALARSGNAAEATKIAEQAAAGNRGDKQAQFNLVQSYLQTQQQDKAARLLEQLRSSGQLTEDGDYRQLFSIYANINGKEADTIAVIQEGLKKAVLKPDYSVYRALGQSYYFSGQIPQSIEAFRKAAPLSSDGDAYLQLARIYWSQQRIPEAKQAAQQALAKGLTHPEQAKKILALPGK